MCGKHYWQTCLVKMSGKMSVNHSWQKWSFLERSGGLRGFCFYSQKSNVWCGLGGLRWLFFINMVISGRVCQPPAIFAFNQKWSCLVRSRRHPAAFLFYQHAHFWFSLAASGGFLFIKMFISGWLWRPPAVFVHEAGRFRLALAVLSPRDSHLTLGHENSGEARRPLDPSEFRCFCS